MNKEATANERDRASARFDEILHVHRAAIAGLELLATLPSADIAVATNIQLRAHSHPEVTTKIANSAAEIRIATASEEIERNYENINGVTLVALCGAFEYLAKSVFVDQAAQGPQQAARLFAKLRIKLMASEVLGLSNPEQWFCIADRLFEQLAEQNPKPYDRVRSFLIDYTHFNFGEEQKTTLCDELRGIDSTKFNEAFLVRNCLVHNGGRISTQLARTNASIRGDPVKLEKTYFFSLVKPLKKLAQGLNGLWLTPLIRTFPPCKRKSASRLNFLFAGCAATGYKPG